VMRAIVVRLDNDGDVLLAGLATDGGLYVPENRHVSPRKKSLPGLVCRTTSWPSG